MPVRGFPGAPIADRKAVFCQRLGDGAVVLAGRCPGSEAVGGDVAAGRFEVLGAGRSGGTLGFGFLASEGLFEVVSDGQGEGADGVSGQAERPAPSGCEAALVFDHGNGFLAGVATSVALFPGGGAEGNVLNTVESVYWDADHALAAVFVFGAQERSGLVGDDVWMVGFGVGGDSPGALGTGVLSAASVELPVSCPPPQGTVDIPVRWCP